MPAAPAVLPKKPGNIAEESDWEAAEKALADANEEQNQAHKINTTIITKAARGEEMELSVLLVHALDLLMLAWSEIDYTEQYISVLKRVQKLEVGGGKMAKPGIEKIAVIGGGSSYTPELIDGFIQNEPNLQVGEIALYDIDEERLDIVGGMAQRMVSYAEMDTKVTLNTNRPQAVEGAKFVLSSMRVGKMQARILDEKIPLKYNVIGQETTGRAAHSKPSAPSRSRWISPAIWKNMPRMPGISTLPIPPAS